MTIEIVGPFWIAWACVMVAATGVNIILTLKQIRQRKRQIELMEKQ